MAYNLNRTGDNVADLLNQVEQKTIYNDATQEEHGLMSAADKRKLDGLMDEVLYGSTSYWDSCRGFIPEQGQLIVYSDHSSYEEDGHTVYVPGIKVGSGNGYVQDLAFVGDDIYRALLAHINNRECHITNAERAYWNNKLNVNDSQEVVGEALVFNRH